MKITELPAYKRLEEMFKQKGYSLGIKNNMQIYSWDNIKRIPENLTSGHYVYASDHGKIKFKDIPETYRTREFFLHALSGAYQDIVEYVKLDFKRFDKQFFKDHIETEYYALEFELNDFEYMPLEFIDEEMVTCAMFKSVNMRYSEKRGDCEDWFYSVHKRKPEVLTQDLYILGARCFAAKRKEKNNFLDITPEEYKTEEFYLALCLKNNTPVMEDIPENILTTNFLVTLLNDDTGNIQCFSDSALEKEAVMQENGIVKFWQAAIIKDGYQVDKIPLNDERAEFFLSIYDKDSQEYEYSFKKHYKNYLNEKNSTPKSENNASELASMMTLAGILGGMNTNSAIDSGTDIMNAVTNRQSMLPIYNKEIVPAEYSKKYDKEEYLLEIYKKIGIQVLEESDEYYYRIKFPENISVIEDDCGYCIKDSIGKTLIHYYDRGPFYDRRVMVDEINITL